MPVKVIYSTKAEDFYYMNINVPCQGACPALTNIPKYIRKVFEGDCTSSYDINHSANIFPGVLGRICSRPCEDMCRHGEPELGHSVNICHIKRAAADYKEKGNEQAKALLPDSGKKVAIVGSGPAGLAAAHDLSLLGIQATVYEALDEPGGMLMYGIPKFRLPRDILKAEIDSILKLGVIIKTGHKIGTDLDMDDLLSEYDAVLLAAGCYQSRKLQIPGENLSGVHSGLEFMMNVCSGRPPEVGKRVLVLGAGFTAFDCARSALRLGAEDVTICLRRTEEDLRVTKDEILDTKREDVKIEALMLSKTIIGNGKVEGVEFVRTRAGTKNSEGKAAITPIEGSEFILSADTVVVATGQGPEPIEVPADKNRLGAVKADLESFKTSIPGLYVAGDYLTGPSTVIEAIAMGRKAAERVASDLTSSSFRENVVRMEDTLITDRERDWDFIPRQEIPSVEPVEERFREQDLEVELGYSKELAMEESKRCYLCYLHYEIDLNRCIYCRYCIDVAPRDCIKIVQGIKTNNDGAITGFIETTRWKDANAIVIDNSRCIRCGECVRVCPVDCISVTRVELMERMKQSGG